MPTRRSFLLASGASVFLGLLPDLHAQRVQRMTVYKSPSCGCCGQWVQHMQANGFQLEVHDVGDVSPIKRRYGVPDSLGSCHTAVVEGYAIEGHVPAADVKRLLRERPRVKGLAVPGMVVGSPGMEGGKPQPYATLAFDATSYRVFAQH